MAKWTTDEGTRMDGSWEKEWVNGPCVIKARVSKGSSVFGLYMEGTVNDERITSYVDTCFQRKLSAKSVANSKAKEMKKVLLQKAEEAAA